MPREVKLRLRTGRDGTFVGVALYDDRGRWSLTARVDRLDPAAAEEIDEYLRTGRLTWLAQRAVRARSDA